MCGATFLIKRFSSAGRSAFSCLVRILKYIKFYHRLLSKIRLSIYNKYRYRKYDNITTVVRWCFRLLLPDSLLLEDVNEEEDRDEVDEGDESKGVAQTSSFICSPS